MCNLVEIVLATAKKSMPLIVDVIVLSMILGPPDTNDDHHELYEGMCIELHLIRPNLQVHGNTSTIPETEYRKRHQLF
jgi:hypothetical protein